MNCIYCGRKLDSILDDFQKSVCRNCKSIPRCPKCGSTSIQVVKKKWGIIMGFATNAVERVCVNCKHKF